jgi:hypothetical protein
MKVESSVARPLSKSGGLLSGRSLNLCFGEGVVAESVLGGDGFLLRTLRVEQKLLWVSHDWDLLWRELSLGLHSLGSNQHCLGLDQSVGVGSDKLLCLLSKSWNSQELVLVLVQNLDHWLPRLAMDLSICSWSGNCSVQDSSLCWLLSGKQVNLLLLLLLLVL